MRKITYNSLESGLIIACSDFDYDNIVGCIQNDIELEVDSLGKVWTSAGVYIADVEFSEGEK